MRYLVAMTSGLSLTLACITPARSNGSPLRWNLFTSKSGFSIIYPKSWYKFDISAGDLTISTSPKRAEGIFFPKGSQMINVSEVDPIDEGEYSSNYEKMYPGISVIRHFSKLMPNKSSKFCRLYYVIEAETEAAPHFTEVDDLMYCKIEGREFSVKFSRWKEDGPDKKGFQVAANMLMSLHL